MPTCQHELQQCLMIQVHWRPRLPAAQTCGPWRPLVALKLGLPTSDDDLMRYKIATSRETGRKDYWGYTMWVCHDTLRHDAHIGNHWWHYWTFTWKIGRRSCPGPSFKCKVPLNFHPICATGLSLTTLFGSSWLWPPYLPACTMKPFFSYHPNSHK